jgi:hypothetical protein
MWPAVYSYSVAVHLTVAECLARMHRNSQKAVEIPGKNTNFFFACNFLFDRFQKYRMGTGSERR